MTPWNVQSANALGICHTLIPRVKAETILKKIGALERCAVYEICHMRASNTKAMNSQVGYPNENSGQIHAKHSINDTCVQGCVNRIAMAVGGNMRGAERPSNCGYSFLL
jgi:hypothetical protein